MSDLASEPLQNARHEKFALAIADGTSGRDAYRNAGFTAKTDNAADACASRLLATDKVAARVAWLKSQIADRVLSERTMSLTQVLEELSKLGRSNLQNVIVAGDNTDDVVQQLREMAPEHAAAIQEITVETYVDASAGADEDQEPQGHGGSLRRRHGREVKRVKIKLHDKRGALSELRRHLEPLKIADPDGRPAGTAAAEVITEKLSELELGRRIAFALERAARAVPAKASDTLAGGAKPAKPAKKKAKAKAKKATKDQQK